MVCCLDYLGQGLQTFSVKGQIINILGFAGPIVSVETLSSANLVKSIIHRM